VVGVGGVAAAPFSITLAAAAPTLGMANGFGEFLDTNSKLISPSNLAAPGQVLSLYASGLGPTNPAVPAGPAPSTLAPTTTLPTLSVGGAAANISFAGLVPGYAGLYVINFTVPKTVQGSLPVMVSIDGQTSNTVTLPVFGITALVNGASFLNTGTATSEEIVTIYANGMGSKDEITGNFTTTTAQGVSVTFNGTAAPIIALVTESSQLSVVVPSGLPTTGTVQVQLTTPTGASIDFPLIMTTADPGIFLLNDPANATADIAVAQFANTTWLVVPDSAATALGLSQNCTVSKANALASCGQPAAPGDYLVLYVTGLGLATPKGAANGTPLTTGEIAPGDGSTLYETTATPTIQVGGVTTPSLFSGIAPGFAGLYQVDFQVPMGVTEGDSVPLTISMPGSTTGMATLSIHSR
jgi:uncharacterized protein (TIGR03437 family)